VLPLLFISSFIPKNSSRGFCISFFYLAEFSSLFDCIGLSMSAKLFILFENSFLSLFKTTLVAEFYIIKVFPFPMSTIGGSSKG